MDWSSVVTGPIDRILSWLEAGFRASFQRRELSRQKDRLLQEFEASRFSWLTLGRLTGALGLDPSDTADLPPTRKLLVRLPSPGPARKDTTPGNRKKPEAKQLWGLTSIVDKKS